MKKRLLFQVSIFIPACFLTMVLMNIFLLDEKVLSAILIKSLFPSIGGVIGIAIATYFSNKK